MMTYYIFSIFIFVCFIFSSSTNAESRRCGEFSNSDLDSLDLVISTKGHEYLIETRKFVDGWQKLTIFPRSADGFDEFSKYKTLVSLPIFQCLCGSLAKESYLHTNKNGGFVFRFQCLDIPSKYPYRIDSLFEANSEK